MKLTFASIQGLAHSGLPSKILPITKKQRNEKDKTG